MTTTTFNRLLTTTALATVMAAGLLAAAPATALPVLFGGGGVTVDGVGAPVGNIAPGQTVTVTGSLLQLQAPDGSIVTIAPGSTFRITGEGDSISFELISGSMRVASNGTPISVSRGGVVISTAGGAFSAFEGEGGGLEGRVNEGIATVTTGTGTRDFARGEGYVATETSIAGTFTPPAATTPGFLLASFESEGADYSPADKQGADGADILDGVTGGGGGYGGTPPVTGVIVPLEGDEFAGYSVVYAADSLGIDGREGASVTIGAGGELNQYDLEPGYEERLERNSNQSLERGNANGNVFIERWAGGETNGNYYNVFNGDTFATLGRTSHQGFHIAYGMPTPQVDLPAFGLATYALVAATAPTMDNGAFAPGTFDGELGLIFGPVFRVGVDFTVTMPGDHVYVIQTAGGAAAPSAVLSYNDLANGMFRVNGIAMAQGGAACPSSNCDASIYGLLTGAAGEDVGIVYRIVDFTAPMDDLFRGTQISGAAVFSQSAYDPSVGAPGPLEGGAVDAPLGAAPYTMASGSMIGEADIALDGRGGLASYEMSNYNPGNPGAVGDAHVTDLWGDEEVTIGRWHAGTTTGYNAGTLSADVQGFHYAIGRAASDLPVYGTAHYTLAAATQPTFVDGGSLAGTLTGSMAIAYGGVGSGVFPRVGFDLEVDMPDDRIYAILTPGGVVNPGASPFIVYTVGAIFPANSIVNGTGGTFTIDHGGRACPTANTCFVSLAGALSGTGGSSAAISYDIWQSGYPAVNIHGAAAFTTTGATVGIDPAPLAAPLADGNYTALNARQGSVAVVSNRPSTFGASGELLTQETANSQTVTIGSSGMAELGGNDDAMWGRWTGGMTGGNGSYAGRDVSGDRGMHWAVGTPTGALPADGSASYQLAGYTAPVFNDGRSAPGTLSGEIVVAWNGASSRIGADLDIVMPGDATYNILTTGGTAVPSTSEIAYISAGRFASAAVPVTVVGGPGAACGGPCTANVQAQAFGAGASTIGLGFEIGTGNADSSITGLGMFTPVP